MARGAGPCDIESGRYDLHAAGLPWFLTTLDENCASVIAPDTAELVVCAISLCRLHLPPVNAPKSPIAEAMGTFDSKQKIAVLQMALKVRDAVELELCWLCFLVRSSCLAQSPLSWKRVILAFSDQACLHAGG